MRSIFRATINGAEARRMAERMRNETHAVVSWIWNADGTAGIQRLAVGSEEACRAYAATCKPVTDDPNEVIAVIPNDALKNDNPERLKGLN